MSTTSHSKSEVLARTNRRVVASLTENSWSAPKKLAPKGHRAAFNYHARHALKHHGDCLS